LKCGEDRIDWSNPSLVGDVVPAFLEIRVKLGIDAQRAIRFFTETLITGDLGPDDSRDGRSKLFLKEPSVVGQAMAVFLYHLELAEDGRVLNHDAAERRVRQYIQWQTCPSELPEPPFQDEELGIM
jgi:hypothetical protein